MTALSWQIVATDDDYDFLMNEPRDDDSVRMKFCKFPISLLQLYFKPSFKPIFDLNSCDKTKIVLQTK